MKKTALNHFQTYKQIIDDRGNPIFLNKSTNSYHYRDGSPAMDASGKPIIKPHGTKTMPVMLPDDISHADELVGQLMKTKNGVAVIQHLQNKVKIASESVGLVNFVVGDETELGDAFVRAAFPPASGVTYKGYDGYSINVGEWSAENTFNEFRRLVKGNIRSYTREDLNMIRKMLQSKNPKSDEKEREDALLSLVGVDRRSPQPQAAAPGNPTFRGPAAAPAAPVAVAGGQSTAAEAIAITHRVLDGLGNLRQFDSTALVTAVETLEQSATLVNNALSDLAPNRFSFEGKRQYDLMAQRLNILLANLDTIRRALPRDLNVWGGANEYDGSGFIDFQVVNNEFMRCLSFLFNLDSLRSELHAQILKPSTAAPAASGGRSRTPAPIEEMTETTIETAYDQNKNKAIDMLNKMISSMPDDMANKAAIFKQFIQQTCNYGQVTTSEKIKEVIRVNCKKFIEDQKGANAVLILNNVDQSFMVERPMAGVAQHEAKESIAFNRDIARLWKEQLTNTEKRRNRAIVLVSEKPIGFNFKVPRVNLIEFYTGDEEADKIIRHGMRNLKRSFQEMGKDPSKIMVGAGDIKRIGLLIQGKSYSSTKTFMESLKRGVMAEKSDTINGRQVVKLATKLVNDEQADEVAGDDHLPIYSSEPKMTIDQLIRDKDSTWGGFVDNIKNFAQKYSEMEKSANKFRDLLDEEQAKPDKDTDKIAEYQQEVAKMETENLQMMQNQPHFMILFGAAGCGKSEFPAVLAKTMDFALFDVNFGEARGSLVGQTEQRTRDTMNSITNLANAVVRLDEMDGQFVAEGQQGESGTYNQTAISRFLSSMQDNMQKFVERNVFIIGTTNNPHLIRKAIVSRAQQVIEVPMPWNKTNFKNFIEQSVGIMQAHNKDGYGPVSDPFNRQGSSKEQTWKDTQKLMDSIPDDGKAMVAESMVGRGFSFRTLLGWITTAMEYHNRYLRSAYDIQLFEGDKERYKLKHPDSFKLEGTNVVWLKQPKLEGIPFTTENLARAAKLTVIKDPHDHNKVVEHVTDQEIEERGLLLEYGFPRLEMELWGKKEKDDQMEMDFGNAPAPSVSQAVSDETFASTDYYYNLLVKSGMVKEGKLVTKAQPRGYYEEYGVKTLPVENVRGLSLLPVRHVMGDV